MATRIDIDRTKERYEELYLRKGLSVRQVAKEIGLSAAVVRKDLKRHGVPRRPLGLQRHVALGMRTAENYTRLYIDEGMGLRGVATELGVTTDVVMKDMRRFGIPTRSLSPTAAEYAGREQLFTDRQSDEKEFPGDRVYVNEPRPVEGLNDKFFDRIDTDLKAYALGLIWSDGNIDVHYSMLRITIQEGDAPVLDAIRSEIGSLPLEWRMPNEKCRGKTPTVTLRVRNYNLTQSLLALGLCENKSARLPHAVPPPPELEMSFVRGIMDGDGSLYRPDYPTICFYNQNPSLREIVGGCWEKITGRRPPTYAPITEGKPRPRLCEIGHRAVAIAHAIYLKNPSVCMERKRSRAEQFQTWRSNKK